MRRIALLALLTSLAACGAATKSTTTAQTHAATAPQTSTSAAASPGPSATSARVRLVRIGRFDSPTYITQAPGDPTRLFVAEQGGRIRVVRGGRKLARPFLDLSSKVSCCGEEGLLSVAFAPDYARSRLFYVDYTDHNRNTHIVEYRTSSDADRAVAGSARQVLLQYHPGPNHNGGLLLFGPDGLLYAGFGDGGAEYDQHGAHGNGQRLSTLLGKVLRIDPRRTGGRPYAVPPTNPFVHRRGVRPEIYDYGLRNPWRFTFDSAGDMIIADVGQDRWEEIDFARAGHTAGLNYGWRPWEGRYHLFPHEQAPHAVFPVFVYSHSGGRCSIIGGYVVRDPALGSLVGRYVYGDYCAGGLRSVRLGPGSARGDRSLGVSVSGLTSFGEDLSGRIYAASQGGDVFRLAAG
jgi:glucose/arabinose dehydrogenase